MSTTLLVRRSFLVRTMLLSAAALLPQSLHAQSQGNIKYKIGLVGAGRIGGSLGRLWAASGHQVMLSARDLGPVKQLAAEIGANASAGTPKQAAAFGEIVVVTVPWGALGQLGHDLASQIKGKVVIDTCNPSPPRDGMSADDALAKGAGVVDAGLLPGTRLVRAFSTVGAAQLVPQAHRAGEMLGIPVGGDDHEAVAIVSQLVLDAGFTPVVVGGLAASKKFDPGTPVYGKSLPAGQVRVILGA